VNHIAVFYRWGWGLRLVLLQCLLILLYVAFFAQMIMPRALWHSESSEGPNNLFMYSSVLPSASSLLYNLMFLYTSDGVPAIPVSDGRLILGRMLIHTIYARCYGPKIAALHTNPHCAMNCKYLSTTSSCCADFSRPARCLISFRMR
jgi:hypothetical protein